MNPENGFVSQTLKREQNMDNDNLPERFSVRLMRLERRLKEIEEKEGKRT